jgi:hypothetical protein
MVMIAEIFKSNLEKIENSISKSKYPNTAKLLYRSILKIEILKNVIFKLEEKDGSYAGNILLRSLFEHFLIAYYIWYDWEKTAKDEKASEYYIQYFISEVLKQEAYQQKIEKIKTGKNYIDSLKFIKKIHPKLDEMKDVLC